MGKGTNVLPNVVPPGDCGIRVAPVDNFRAKLLGGLFKPETDDLEMEF